MQRMVSGLVGVVVGLGLLGAGSLAGAQSVIPVTPIQQPQQPNVPPTPVTPSTPVAVVADVPMCDELVQVLPTGNMIERTECLSSARTLCFATASAFGATTDCTGVFVSTPKLPPPPPVVTPNPSQAPAH